jgi:hypothetical protein
MDRARANRLSGSVLLLVLLAGCASDYGQRYDEAERLRQQAAAEGYEWLGTAGLLDKAQQRAAAGDTDAALELVEQARFQADAALRQAEAESDAWRRRVLQ